MAKREDKRIFVLHNVIELLNFPALPDAFCCHLAPFQSFCGLLFIAGGRGGGMRTLETAFPRLPCQLVAGSFCQWQGTCTRLDGGKKED